MSNKYEIRLSGSGGQGLILAGIILADAGLKSGKNSIQSQSYGPEARGGASKAEVIISDGEINYPKVEQCDILLSLTQKSYDDTDDSEEFVKKVLKNEISSLKNLADNLSQKKLDEATDLIFNANKIYIIGMRVSHTLALYLGFYLDVILDNVKVINVGSFSLFEQMVRISEDDLLICLSYPRYSKQTIDAVNFAKERKAKILSN